MAPEAGLGLPGEAPSQYRGAAHGRAVPPTGPHRRPEAVWPVGEGGQGAAGGEVRGENALWLHSLFPSPPVSPGGREGQGTVSIRSRGRRGPAHCPHPLSPGRWAQGRVSAVLCRVLLQGAASYPPCTPELHCQVTGEVDRRDGRLRNGPSWLPPKAKDGQAPQAPQMWPGQGASTAQAEGRLQGGRGVLG